MARLQGDRIERVVPSKPFFRLNSSSPGCSTIRWRVSHRFRSRRHISAGASTAMSCPLLTQKCTDANMFAPRDASISQSRRALLARIPSGGAITYLLSSEKSGGAARTQASRHSRDFAAQSPCQPTTIAANGGARAYTRVIARLLRAGFSFFSGPMMAAVLTACSRGSAHVELCRPRAEGSAAQVVVSNPCAAWTNSPAGIARPPTRSSVARAGQRLIEERIAFKEVSEVQVRDSDCSGSTRRPYTSPPSTAQRPQLERCGARRPQLAHANDERARDTDHAHAISREEFDTRQAGLAPGRRGRRAAEAALTRPSSISASPRCARRSPGAVGDAMLDGRQSGPGRPERADSVGLADPVYVYSSRDEQTYLRYAHWRAKAAVRLGAIRCAVGAANDRAFRFPATVNFVNNQVDSATGTINLRAVVHESRPRRYPGVCTRTCSLGAAPSSGAMLIDGQGDP